MTSKRRPREEACYICGHYHDFEGGEPCGVCGHVMASPHAKHEKAILPTNVIPGFLYLGSYDTASRVEVLKTMGITHILNTVPSCQALYKNTFTYHTVAASPPDLQECFSFIESAGQLPDSKVLVYCMTGTSRSPTVVIGYLMKARGWRLAESYKWVKDKRPSVNIKQDDAQRLMELEQALHGQCSVPNGFAALDQTCGFFPLLAPGSFTENGNQQQQSSQPAFMPAPSSAPIFGAPAHPQQQQQPWSMAATMAFGGAQAGPGPAGPGALPVFTFGGGGAPGGSAGANNTGSSEMEM